MAAVVMRTPVSVLKRTLLISFSYRLPPISSTVTYCILFWFKSVAVVSVLLPFAAHFEYCDLLYFVLVQKCGCRFRLPFHTIEGNVLAISNRCLLMKLIVA